MEKKDKKLEEELNKIYLFIKPYLTKEALQRLSNIKLVYPDRYIKVLLILYQNIQAGRIEKVDEELLKKILLQLSDKRKPEIHID
ncbi:MAG: DNA-binding protein [Nanopusillaceae archaeon]